MTTVRDLHDRAMALADEMLLARQRGQHRKADRLANEAFLEELRAATLAFGREVSAPTRLILLRSMAHLARDARRWSEGIDLVLHALVADDLRGYRPELFRIVDTLRTYEHLSIEGVRLSDADVQLTVAGPEAAPGFARAEEVTRRVENVRALMMRNAMRRAGLAFEAGVPKAHSFRTLFTPFLSTARAASYAITLKFGVDEQWDLGLPSVEGEPATRRRKPSVSRVLDDVIASAKAYAEGGPSAVGKVIHDSAYTKNAVSLLRQLSPDSRRVNTVGLTVFRRGQAVPVALPDRDAFDSPAAVWFSKDGTREALPATQVEHVGRLLEGSAKSPVRSRAAIVLNDARAISFHYDEATHGDVIVSYWKHIVRVRLRRDGQRGWILMDIADA